MLEKKLKKNLAKMKIFDEKPTASEKACNFFGQKVMF